MIPDPLRCCRVIREPGTTCERVWYEASCVHVVMDILIAIIYDNGADS